MAKPRLIILVRHAQSEGNKNREIHQSIPDHRVKLTQDGVAQAHEAGLRLRKLLRPDDKLHFFTSPYRRTRETTEGILATLTSDDPEPSAFRRSNIKVYEEPRLREQDFGNFQPCGAEMERMWQERADYGHFFYRIPNGESAADAYDRVSGFNESLWRQFGEDDFASVCVLVTHGLMSRVFLMKWYHFTVEYFEDLRNINHCEFLIMRKQDNGKYFLENNLRTWSELRRERAALVSKDKDKEDKEAAKLERSKTVTVARRWGGCPNGCNHTSHYKKRHDLEILRQKDVEHGGPAPYGSSPSTTTTTTTTTASTTATIASRRQRLQPAISSDEDDDDYNHSDAIPTPDIDITRTADDPTSSGPGATASFFAPNDRLRRVKSPHLHVGRDFGGTYSGHASVAGSDTEASEDEAHRKHRVASLNARIKASASSADDADDDDDAARNGESDEWSRGACANRLGDAPPSCGDAGSEGDAEPEDLDKAEKEDRSIRGSVY